MKHCKQTFYLQCYLSFAIILLAVYMAVKVWIHKTQT